MDTRERLLEITKGKEVLTVSQFADFLSMDPKTVRKGIWTKNLPGSIMKYPGRTMIVIPVDSVAAWIEKASQVRT